MNLKDIELGLEFEDQIYQFMHERYAEIYPATERQKKLTKEEAAIKEQLQVLLKDNAEADRLFKEYENNRDNQEGEISGLSYEHGFSDGIQFMMFVLGGS